ncbi:MAG: hypothetical protein L3J91_07625, partial [Thermoplasmata archaeon]|nr:hypothetical protein [Thermoplasmata archaeon]
ALHAPLVDDFRAAARRFGEPALAVIRDFLAIGRALYERHGPLLREDPAVPSPLPESGGASPPTRPSRPRANIVRGA